MPAAPLIPQALWFRYAFACPRVDAIPLRATAGGGLLDLPEGCRLPAPVRLEGRAPWADMRVGWNPGGLGVAIRVAGRTAPLAAPAPTAELADGVQVWIDTRDTRDVHRATRYAHRFEARLAPARGGTLEVAVAQKPIPRAMAEAPRAPADAVRARAARLPDGWRLELFFPAESLHGFDPEVNRRLGLMLHAADTTLGDEFLGVGREFPVEGDPSLWATLELRDDPPA
jgi:hypothetical protein